MVNETSGTWRAAEEVPGAAALNAGGLAKVTSVSCASAGTAPPAASMQDGSFNAQAFIVNEINGIWRTAEEVPGTAALNTGGDAVVTSVSCASAGNCAAGGSYRDCSGHDQAFVVNETNGVWHTAKEVPGTAALNTGGAAEIALGVVRLGRQLQPQAGPTSTAPVTSRRSWSTRPAGPGAPPRRSPAPPRSTSAASPIASVSCASAGNCSAGGNYLGSHVDRQAFDRQRDQRDLAHR